MKSLVSTSNDFSTIVRQQRDVSGLSAQIQDSVNLYGLNFFNEQWRLLEMEKNLVMFLESLIINPTV